MERLHALTQEEKQLVLDAPVLITILIGGADGKIDHKEEDRAKRAVTFRSHTGDPFLFEYYEIVEPQFEARLAHYLVLFSQDTTERTTQVSNELAKLTEILSKIEKIYAKALYENWKNLAQVIASESGGFLGFFSVSSQETHLIDLKMIGFEGQDQEG